MTASQLLKPSSACKSVCLCSHTQHSLSRLLPQLFLLPQLSLAALSEWAEHSKLCWLSYQFFLLMAAIQRSRSTGKLHWCTHDTQCTSLAMTCSAHPYLLVVTADKASGRVSRVADGKNSLSVSVCATDSAATLHHSAFSLRFYGAFATQNGDGICNHACPFLIFVYNSCVQLIAASVSYISNASDRLRVWNNCFACMYNYCLPFILKPFFLTFLHQGWHGRVPQEACTSASLS